MSRSEEERLGDVRAAIERCLAYRDHLSSVGFGSMAYAAVLRNLAVGLVSVVPSDISGATYGGTRTRDATTARWVPSPSVSFRGVRGHLRLPRVKFSTSITGYRLWCLYDR